MNTFVKTWGLRLVAYQGIMVGLFLAAVLAPPLYFYGAIDDPLFTVAILFPTLMFLSSLSFVLLYLLCPTIVRTLKRLSFGLKLHNGEHREGRLFHPTSGLCEIGCYHWQQNRVRTWITGSLILPLPLCMAAFLVVLLIPILVMDVSPLSSRVLSLHEINMLFYVLLVCFSIAAVFGVCGLFRAYAGVRDKLTMWQLIIGGAMYAGTVGPIWVYELSEVTWSTRSLVVAGYEVCFVLAPMIATVFWVWQIYRTKFEVASDTANEPSA